ncbi:MAG: hypothetical protein AB1689_09020 [Thermodesulfobacteriota bacterium]
MWWTRPSAQGAGTIAEVGIAAYLVSLALPVEAYLTAGGLDRDTFTLGCKRL